MTHQRKQGFVWAMAVAVALMMTTTPALAEEEDEGEGEAAFCPGSQGGYKNSDQWPVDNMSLGAHYYDEARLRALLDAPTRGDASIILARQLIAAELNVANGHNASVHVDDANTTAAQAIQAAHEQVGDNELPAKVRGKAGDEWTAIASMLDGFNNGYFTEGCFDEAEEEEEPEEEVTEEVTRQTAE